MQQQGFMYIINAKKSDHIHPILQTLHWYKYRITLNTEFLVVSASIPSLTHSLSICLMFNSISDTFPQYLSSSTLHSNQTTVTHIQHRYVCHPSCKQKPLVKNHFFKLAHLFGTFCLKHSDSSSSDKIALKTCLLNNFLNGLDCSRIYPSPILQGCLCVYMLLVLKCSVLPLCVIDGLYRNPLVIIIIFKCYF